MIICCSFEMKQLNQMPAACKGTKEEEKEGWRLRNQQMISLMNSNQNEAANQRNQLL